MSGNPKSEIPNSGKSRKERRLAPGPGLEGFTLIELTISAALMSIILTGAYLCLSAAVSSQKLLEPRNELFQNARVAMAMMSADLRSACPLAKDLEFVGMQRDDLEIEAGNLDFATHNYFPQRPNEGDFCEVSYFLREDAPESGQYSLWRRRDPTIAAVPMSGGRHEEIIRGVRGLRFEYYDGFDWYDTWGEVGGHQKEKKTELLPPNLTGMPEAVRITLWLDPNPPKPRAPAEQKGPPTQPPSKERPLVFQTVVRLNLAAASQSGFSGRSGGDGSDAGQPMAPGRTP